VAAYLTEPAQVDRKNPKNMSRGDAARAMDVSGRHVNRTCKKYSDGVRVSVHGKPRGRKRILRRLEGIGLEAYMEHGCGAVRLEKNLNARGATCRTTRSLPCWRVRAGA